MGTRKSRASKKKHDFLRGIDPGGVSHWDAPLIACERGSAGSMGSMGSMGVARRISIWKCRNV